MISNAKLHLAVAVMASLVLSSCASTQLSRTWRDASYTAGPLKKILVVAIRKNQLRRKTWETGFATALAKHGVDVTPSYTLIAETLPDTGLINTIVREGSFDGIVMIGRVFRTTTESVTAGVEITAAESPTQQWGGWYYASYAHEYYPGYPVMEEIAKAEIKVWATQGRGTLIWTGVGEVHENGDDEDVSGEIISLIVPELMKQGVIGEGS
jgi:hypothetical protein